MLFEQGDLFDIFKKGSGKAEKTESGKFNKKVCQINQELEKCFPEIEQGNIYHFATAGAWSMHDLIFRVIKLHGSIKLTGATWSMATKTTDMFMRAFKAGDIEKMDFLFDWRVEVRNPTALNMIKYGDICNLRVASCHAKVAVIEAEDGFCCAILGSANFTNNPRIEAGVIDCSRSAVDFHKSWIMGEIENSKPFGIDTRRLKSDGRK